MTIEEMITLLVAERDAPRNYGYAVDFNHFELSEAQRMKFDAIIAALRAGQAMRDAHQKQFEWALQYGEARLTCCEDAAQAWDAATAKRDDK